MFQLQNNKGSLELLQADQQVLSGFEIEIARDTGKPERLTHKDSKMSEHTDQFGSWTEYEKLYELEGEISFSLKLRCYQSFVLASGSVVLHSERLFARNNYLAPEAAIRIKFNPLENEESLVAHYLHKDWWTRPHFDKDVRTMPPRTQSMLWKTADNYFQILPVPDATFKSELRGHDEGFEITSSSYDGGRNQGEFSIFLLGKDNDPFELSRQLTKKVARLHGEARTIDERTYPEQLDYFGWCSWDAFYQEVNAEGILEKAEELHSHDLPVKWVLIDDGWSDLKDGRLQSFGTDPEKFPEGLAPVTSKLKSDLGVEAVGVWHTFAGYWGGVVPGSELAKEMTPYIYETNSQKSIPYPDKAKGYGFWNAWHGELRKQGIDFVKVDAQSGINNFTMYQLPVGQASRESHQALEASVGVHFNHSLINCMGMAQENVWNRPISAVSRSSDDFVPEDEEGFGEHALQNVYNSFWHGEIYYGDWDMFWTMHKDAGRHAVLRAVSGGPIYTSDPVGKTDPAVVWPLIFRNGRIIRCDQPGKPTKDMLTVDPVHEQKALKVQNTAGDAGILGVFNISDSHQPVETTISPADVYGCHADKYIVYDYFNEQASEMMCEDMQTLTLEEEGYNLYLFLPKTSPVTPVGMLDKYITPATFEKNYATQDQLSVTIKEGGKFAFYSEKEPGYVGVDGETVTVESKGDSLYVVDCSSLNKRAIIEVKL
ncbi:Sip1-related alpha-galactosidase [Thalassobacillus pellis]|uniref:Sip1-related alpha-galactosidase n=1 Tax=Thalassobacillus pellis TaxID=748008 RepID=UPI0019606D1A|nr:Sip1-related alpha-galactosidase [Thalassobacillus pellis]MBM7551526.1 hypothetical protein [Thalassobacillus pellis]